MWQAMEVFEHLGGKIPLTTTTTLPSTPQLQLPVHWLWYISYCNPCRYWIQHTLYTSRGFDELPHSCPRPLGGIFHLCLWPRSGNDKCWPVGIVSESSIGTEKWQASAYFTFRWIEENSWTCREAKYIAPFKSCTSAKIILDPLLGISQGIGFVQWV
jgi:hypothetical protein